MFRRLAVVKRIASSTECESKQRSSRPILKCNFFLERRQRWLSALISNDWKRNRQAGPKIKWKGFVRIAIESKSIPRFAACVFKCSSFQTLRWSKFFPETGSNPASTSPCFHYLLFSCEILYLANEHFFVENQQFSIQLHGGIVSWVQLQKRLWRMPNH